MNFLFRLLDIGMSNDELMNFFLILSELGCQRPRRGRPSNVY